MQGMSMERAVLVAIVVAGCAAPISEPQGIRERYALSRLGLDPLTEVGYVLDREGSLAEQLGVVFELAACDGPGPVLVDLDGERREGQRVGTLTMLIGSLEEGDGCDGTGVFSIQALSYGPDGEPLVEGPLHVQGRTAEARIPLSRVGRGLLELVPVWWTVTARRSQGSEALGDAEARTLWDPRQLAATSSARTVGISLLDELIARGAQPDFDVDRDGLERLVDTDGDGRVDGCVDGDGASWEGAECMHDARFVDGFELAMRFRLVPATIREP